jgi:hypothetical protein
MSDLPADQLCPEPECINGNFPDGKGGYEPCRTCRGTGLRLGYKVDDTGQPLDLCRNGCGSWIVTAHHGAQDCQTIQALRGLLAEFDAYATFDPGYDGSPFHARVQRALLDRPDEMPRQPAPLATFDGPNHRSFALASGMTVSVHGSYGEPGGSVHILDESGAEIVMWDADEWTRDPSLVYAIFELMSCGTSTALITLLGKRRIADDEGHRHWVP